MIGGAGYHNIVPGRRDDASYLCERRLIVPTALFWEVAPLGDEVSR